MKFIKSSRRPYREKPWGWSIAVSMIILATFLNFIESVHGLTSMRAFMALMEKKSQSNGKGSQLENDPETEVEKTFACPEALNVDADLIGQGGTFRSLDVRILMGCRGDPQGGTDMDWQTGQMEYGYTFNQLKSFYDIYNSNKNPRPAPKRSITLCVKPDQFTGNAADLKPVMDNIEILNKGSAKPPPMWKDAKDGSHLENIHINQLYYKGNDDGAKKSEVGFRQWMHIDFKFDAEVKGLIVQAVDGLLGVPVGEFVTMDQLSCSGAGVVSPEPKSSMIIPCKYRPRAMFKHPGVILFNKLKLTASFHFNWLNIPCQELVALQFLFIPITNVDSKDVKAFVTPVYEFPTVDPKSLDGLPTPYHPSYKNKINCGGGGKVDVKLRSNSNSVWPAFEHRSMFESSKTPDYDEADEDAEPQVANFDPSSSLVFNSSLPRRAKVSSRVRRQAGVACRDLLTPCTATECSLGLISVCWQSLVKYNAEYDDCIATGAGLQEGTCPPGPYKCVFAYSLCRWQNFEANQRRRRTSIDILRGCTITQREPPAECKFPNVDKSPDFHNKFEAPGTFNRYPADSGNSDYEEYEAMEMEKDLSINPALKTGNLEPMSSRRKLSPLNAKVEDPYEKSTTKRPPTTTPGFYLTPKQAIQKDFELIGEYYYKKQKRVHAQLEILAFFLVFPGAVLISRYFKETQKIAFFGIPVWLVIHFSLIYFGLMLIWVGYVAAAGNNGRGVFDCKELDKMNFTNATDIRKYCKSHQSKLMIYSHIILGCLTFAAFHFVAFTGWYRPEHDGKRIQVVKGHAVGGYVVPILAAVTTFVTASGTCLEVDIFVIIFLVLTVGTFGALTFVQIKDDQELGVKGRSHFPMMEGIQSRRRSRKESRMFRIKVYVAAGGMGLHLLFYLLLVVSYALLNYNDKKVLTGGKEEFASEPIIRNRALFMECKSLNYQLLRGIVSREEEIEDLGLIANITKIKQQQLRD